MTSVYCKPTSSGVFTSFGSDINTTCCLRYYTGYSNFAQILNVFIKRLTSLKTIFENNAYPKSFVWFLYQKVLGQGFYKKESSTESLKKRTYWHPSFSRQKVNATENSFSYLHRK